MASKKTDRLNKRILSVLGVLVLAVGGGYVGSTLTGGGGQSAAAATSDYSSATFLDGIKERGELRVGVAENPPMSGTQADGTLGGPNVVPLRELAEALGVDFTPVAADWSNIVAGLQAGRYDFAADLSPTTERSLAVQFTTNIYTYEQVFVVKADSPYLTAEDVIAGGPISSVTGVAASDALVATGADVLAVDSHANQISALESGRAIATYLDMASAVNTAQANPNYKIIVPETVIYRAGAGYGVAADADPRSMQTINFAIQNALDSGEFDRALIAAGIQTDDLTGLVKQ